MRVITGWLRLWRRIKIDLLVHQRGRLRRVRCGQCGARWRCLRMTDAEYRWYPALHTGDARRLVPPACERACELLFSNTRPPRDLQGPYRTGVSAW